MAMYATIGGQRVEIIHGTVSGDTAVAQRSALSFTVVDPSGAFSFSQGQPVILYADDGSVLMRRWVGSAARARTTQGGLLEHSIVCVDNHYLADKRLAPYTATSKSAGAIATDLATQFLADEGVVISTGVNLFTANQSSWETDTTGVRLPLAGGVTVARDTSTYWTGTASLRVTFDGSYAYQPIEIELPYEKLTAGATYTFSLYARASSGAASLRIYCQQEAPAIGLSPVLTFNLSNDWQRYTFTTTMPNPLAGAQYNLRLDTGATAGSVAGPLTLWLDGLQVEEASSASPWQMGQQTPTLPTPPTSAVVTRSGQQFMLNGEPFKFVGFNAYDLVVGNNSPALQLSRLQDMHAQGATVVRTWAFGETTSATAVAGYFQYGATGGQWNEATFVTLDNLIANAASVGVKLILCLANQWTDYGGKAVYVDYYNTANSTSLVADNFQDTAGIITLFEAFIHKLLTRVNTVTGVAYNVDPTIMAWECINEGRYTIGTDTNVNTLSSARLTTMTNWYTTISQYIKSLDTTHLVGTGSITQAYDYISGDPVHNGTYYGLDYLTQHQIASIDYCDYHLYPAQAYSSSGSDCVLKWAIANPSAAATGSATAGAGLAVGSYTIGYYWIDATGDTTLGSSTSAAITTTSANAQITMTRPSALPHNATGYQWFMVSAPSGVPTGPVGSVQTAVGGSYIITAAPATTTAPPSANTTGGNAYYAQLIQFQTWAATAGKPVVVGEVGIDKRNTVQNPIAFYPRSTYFQHTLDQLRDLGHTGLLLWNYDNPSYPDVSFGIDSGVTYTDPTIPSQNTSDMALLAVVVSEYALLNVAPAPASVSTITSGPTIGSFVSNYATVAQCLDALAQKSQGYTWWIDDARGLYFGPNNPTPAPTTITDALFERDTEQVTHGNDLYRNTQYVLGGMAETSAQTETRIGDGNTTAFTMGYPLANAPTITLNGASQTVGVGPEGQVDSGKQWYWNKGSNVITQSNSGVKLVSTDTLQVVYIGQFPVVTISQDSAGISARQAREGGTTSGIVEAVATDTTLSTTGDAFQAAAGYLARYSQDSETLTFVTQTAGFAQGQLATVDVPAYNLNNIQMLIEEVQLSDVGPAGSEVGVLYYTVKAVVGPLNTSWVQFFGALASQTQTFVDSINLGNNSVVNLLADFTATLKLQASLTATVYACPLLPWTLPVTLC